MIVKIGKRGNSFKGVLTQYLMHDTGHAKSANRVAWTHTLNLAHDHIESAVHEMFRTAFDAELLKAEAGIHAGGSKVEKPVLHVSLSWHPSEQSDKEAMIKAADGFLKHMGWQDHQCAIVAHSDTNHRHIHLVINVVNPETGLALDQRHDRHRAQAWAKNFELERGQVFCEQRLKSKADREAAMPRPSWMDMRDQVEKELKTEQVRLAFDPSYMARRDVRLTSERQEWDILKDLQKEERLAFFTEGKQLYKDIHRAAYKEVREEFRGAWQDYYAAKRDGMNLGVLAEIKAGLVEQQKKAIEERREPIAAKLREERDAQYRALLDAQKEQRYRLTNRQERDQRSPELLGRVYGDKSVSQGIAGAKREDALSRFGVERGRAAESPATHYSRPERSTPRQQHASSERLNASPAHGESRERPPKRDIGGALAGGLLSLIGGLGESLVGGHSGPPKGDRSVDALERFEVKRGLPPPPDPHKAKARDEMQAREDWYAWKKKRELDQSRSG
jgi:hypothetical protein